VVEEILSEIEDVHFNRLTAHDVVRHRLVGHIVAAYDDYEARRDDDRAQGDGEPEPRRAAGPRKGGPRR
jgi:phosphate starvation-inducible PhoH-like protein